MNVLAYRVYATMFFYITKLYQGLLGPNVEVKVRGRSTFLVFMNNKAPRGCEQTDKQTRLKTLPFRTILIAVNSS